MTNQVERTAENLWQRIGANWQEFSGLAKATWGNLTDDDLAQIAGKRDQLVGKLRDRYAVGKQEAEGLITEWEKSLTP